MGVSQFLFSFKGRIPRSTYWLKFIIPYLVGCILAIKLDSSVGAIELDGSDPTTGPFFSLFFILSLCPLIAVTVKRLHDRNRSAWFVLLNFIPFLNLWIMVETGFLVGTGPNKYGADPLDKIENRSTAYEDIDEEKPIDDQTESVNNETDITTKLKQLKVLFDEGILTEKGVEKCRAEA